jgi:hypothetical protein
MLKAQGRSFLFLALLEKGTEVSVKTNYLRVFTILIAAMAATVLVMALVGIKPAQATFPGANGNIAFAGADNNGYTQIYTISPSGGPSTKITSQDGFAEDPVYSPDGNTIAYDIQPAGTGENNIYTIPATGGTPTQLSNSGGAYCPTFSPDGNTIAYGDDQVVGGGQLYKIPSSGGTPTKVNGASNVDYCPAYSPDGTKISYTGRTPSDTLIIYTIPSSGGTASPLLGSAGSSGNISYSPDGTKITFSAPDSNGNDQIYTIPSRGGSPIQITTGGTDQNPDSDFYANDPSFSPDGTKIAYTETSDATDFDNRIQTIPATGGTPTTIGCAFGTSTNWGAGNSTTSLPSICSVNPAPGATVVPRNTNATVTFSTDMDQSTISKSTFQLSLWNKKKKTYVPVTDTGVTYNSFTKTATLDPFPSKPTKLLGKAKTYKATLTTGVKDAAGHPLSESDSLWTFNTGKK